MSKNESFGYRWAIVHLSFHVVCKKNQSLHLNDSFCKLANNLQLFILKRIGNDCDWIVGHELNSPTIEWTIFSNCLGRSIWNHGYMSTAMVPHVCGFVKVDKILSNHLKYWSYIPLLLFSVWINPSRLCEWGVRIEIWSPSPLNESKFENDSASA